MQVLDVTAPDISCDHCKRNIEGVLADERGVNHVEVDVQAKRIQLDYDDTVIDAQTLRAKLTEIGYPPS